MELLHRQRPFIESKYRGINSLPEERPVIRAIRQLRIRGRSAGVRNTSTIRRAVVVIILVIGLKDGESLRLASARVVRALSSLNGGGRLRRGATGRRRVLVACVGGARVEGCESGGGEDGDEDCGLHGGMA